MSEPLAIAVVTIIGVSLIGYIIWDSCFNNYGTNKAKSVVNVSENESSSLETVNRILKLADTVIDSEINWNIIKKWKPDKTPGNVCVCEMSFLSAHLFMSLMRDKFDSCGLSAYESVITSLKNDYERLFRNQGPITGVMLEYYKSSDLGLVFSKAMKDHSDNSCGIPMFAASTLAKRINGHAFLGVEIKEEIEGWYNSIKSLTDKI